MGEKGQRKRTFGWDNRVAEYYGKFRTLSPGSPHMKFSFRNFSFLPIASWCPSHPGILSWPREALWSLLWIRSLRPAILLAGDCHWGKRGEGKTLLGIQLVLHKEWCTWKIDHDTAPEQILLIMQYLNTQYIPLNDKKKPKVTANKSHSSETKRGRDNFSMWITPQ